MINTKKVIPNLTPRGKDIMVRLRNRTLVYQAPKPSQYNDDKFRDIRKLSKIDAAREHLNVTKEIQSINKKLKSNAKQKPE